MRRAILYILLIYWTASTSFATVYNVSPTGSDSGDGSTGNPWRTIKYAVSRVAANQGHIIRIAAGTFIENGPIDVPPGVSIEGAGIDQTIIKANSSFYYNPGTPGFATDKFLFSFKSNSVVAGNQTIKNFTIDGDGKKVHGGIYVNNRNNIVVENIKIQYVNFSGLWFWGVSNSAIKGLKLKDCAWGSAGWCSGALQIANGSNVDISEFDIDEGRGYGIKNLGQNQNSAFPNIKLHDGRVSVAPAGAWNNGSAPNITIEFWGSSFGGTEIYNCYLDNHVSLVTYPVVQRTTPLKIYNNVFDILGPRAKGNGYGLELSVYDVEIYNNWFNGGSTPMVNWGDHQFENWNIHHNTIYGVSSGYPTAMVVSYKGGLKNVNIYNNTAEMTGSATVNFIEFNNGGVGENINIKNNLIINSNSSYAWYPNRFISLEKGSSVKNLQVTNNLLYKLPIGSVGGTYTNNLFVDPKITASGARPTPYYLPQAGSPLIDAGVNVGFPFQGAAPDIGAHEFTSNVPPPANTLPQVSITSPANNANFAAGSAVTVNANASDADGTIGRVEFFSGTTKLGEDLTSPYTFTWNNVAAGSYSLTARATDNKNGVTTSAPISITVTDSNTPPVVTLTAPANNALFATGSTVNITATATDQGGTITKVEFFSGTTKLGEDLTSPYSFSWINVPNGNYTISAKATDNQNSVTTSGSVSITVSTGNNPPAVSLTAPAANATFTAGATVTLTANASDTNGSITKVEFFNGAVKLGEDLTNPYSFSWTNVPAGAFTLTARATDNQTAVTTSAAVNITVNSVSVPPTVSLTSPSSNASFSAGTSINLTANASPTGATISKVEFFNGTTKLGEDLTAPYTFVWANAPVGTHSLGAKATDSKNMVGNSALTKITVLNINVPPTVNLTSPANNAAFLTNATVTLTATAADTDGTITKVEFYNGTTKLGEDLSSPFSFTWNNVPNGNYALTARAVDNQSAVTTSATSNIVVSSSPSPPSVSLTSPANGATFFANSSITINATASTPSGTITKVEFFNGTTKLGEDLTSPYSFVWNNVPAGSYTLTAKVTNSASAVATSAAVNIIVSVSSSPPVVAITSPASQAVFTAGSTIAISATASDVNGTITRVEFLNGTTKLGEDLTSPYNFSWTNVPEGTYLIIAKATDNQGVTATAEVEVFVNAVNSPPQANAGEDITAQLPVSSLVITGTGTDADGVISTYVWTQISGPNEVTLTQDSFGQLGLANLEEGTYVFELAVTDNGGMTGTDQVSVDVIPSLLSLEQIPRFFSPNGDGVNDRWEWPRIELYADSRLLVYNRFGQKVYEAVSYQNDWDGTINGKPLQEDAYYYVIKLSNTDLKGAVRIVR